MFENSHNLLKLNKNNFKNDHFNHNKELIIMLYSPYCPYCKNKEESWTNLSDIPDFMDNLDIGICDINSENEIANSLDINTVPSFMYQKNNKLYEIPNEFITELINLLKLYKPDSNPKSNINSNPNKIKYPYSNPTKKEHKVKQTQHPIQHPILNSSHVKLDNSNQKLNSLKKISNEMALSKPKVTPDWLKNEDENVDENMDEDEDENEDEDQRFN
jgi:hypothetical protein